MLIRLPPRCVRVNQMPKSSRYELVITATARRQLAESLPTSIAFAAYEFIIGPLLENPQRVGKQLMTPLDDRHSARRVPHTLSAKSDPHSRLPAKVRKQQSFRFPVSLPFFLALVGSHLFGNYLETPLRQNNRQVGGSKVVSKKAAVSAATLATEFTFAT